MDAVGLEPDGGLAQAIEKLPGRRFVFTNGCRDHAGRILERLTDVDFKRWTRWVVTATGLVYLVQAAQLFARGG